MLRKLINIGAVSVLALSPLALAVGCASNASHEPRAVTTADRTGHDDPHLADERGETGALDDMEVD